MQWQSKAKARTKKKISNEPEAEPKPRQVQKKTSLFPIFSQLFNPFSLSHMKLENELWCEHQL